MQTQETDSPRAAARLLALALVADGSVGQEELDVLDAARAHELLDLSRDELFDALCDFCREVLETPPSAWSHDCPLDECEVARLVAQITRPAMRRRLLQLCLQIAEADGFVAEGESFLLNAAVEHWGLQRQMLTPANEVSLARTA